MTTLLVLFAVSLSLSLLFMPLARNLAVRIGLTDKPDQRRKLHDAAIPMAGGIAVLFASLFTIPLVLLGDLCPWSKDFFAQSQQWLGLAAAAITIGLVGVLDDLGYLRGRHKLVGQILAVSILLCTGLIVQSIRIANMEFELGILAIPFTAFFLLGAINSLNLLDGMDGLLGTVALIVTLAFAGMAAISGKWETACVAVTMAGALVGFLRYNLPPASIYLGDSGSMLIGLVIGALAIKGSLKGGATFALAAPAAVLAIPIIDTLAAIFRRKLTGRSIFTTDRGHLHHCLLRLGFSKSKVLIIVASFCLLAASGAYLCVTLDNEWLALVAAVSVAVVLVGLRWFGHGEALLVADRVKGLAGSLLKLPNSTGCQDSSICLQGSGAWDDHWLKLTQTAEDLTLETLRLDINAPSLHESYHGRWVNPSEVDAECGDHSWSAAIPLVWQGQTVGRLEVSGGRDDQPVWQKVAALTKLVEEMETVLCKLAEDASSETPPTLLPRTVHYSHEPLVDLTLSK